MAKSTSSNTIKNEKKQSAQVEQGRGRRIELQGEVIANKMNKTISVLVYRMIKHAKYGKYIRKSSVIKAHDEHQKCQVGDTVKIYETKPISKTKHWALSEVLSSTK
jgi:small subunit ribosomal protein S17